ncbi:hypothetical protein [Devosia rhizoryzae]|uniref:Uncharacterized protein n=1 Tax=Devosia rhizoryzae TaxID=2774137 RepID=A0ABX7C818_9HYPH|nr:hypothetical protein [Devosia rhizoryzae]QQR38111.1 hypothetical protein JI748_09925 [Devosia rhizoryzae]
MNLPTRHMLLGMTLGAACATALAAFGPGYVLETFADEMPAGFDTDKLVKFDDRYYEVDYDPSVSTDPISTVTVKKIEAGRVSHVQISSTATGTYSTDALTSPHVQYPGIEVEPAAKTAFFFSSYSRGKWTAFGSYNGNSFVSIGRWR